MENIKVGDQYTIISTKKTREFMAAHPEIVGYSSDGKIITILLIETEEEVIL